MTSWNVWDIKTIHKQKKNTRKEKGTGLKGKLNSIVHRETARTSHLRKCYMGNRDKDLREGAI